MVACHVGLISGTSMDGIDAVVVELDLAGNKVCKAPRLLAARTCAISGLIRSELDALRQDPDDFPLARLGQLDALMGNSLAQAALDVIHQAGQTPSTIASIGSHGQTVLHRMDVSPTHTFQIGDPSRIAQLTGITTVADFRRADVAAGGQGAPLAPLLHGAVLGKEDERRAVVNLGGIANVTILNGTAIEMGFDTGPANCFLDLWFRRHHTERFDQSGNWAATGRSDERWLNQLMRDPYFTKSAPKSTGIEYFSERWLSERLPPWADDRPQDVQATLAEFTAVSLSRAFDHRSLDRVLICGGGVMNSDLIGRIQSRLNAPKVETTDAYGLPADYLEAILFAFLAAVRLEGYPLDTRTFTGARSLVHLGAIYESVARNA